MDDVSQCFICDKHLQSSDIGSDYSKEDLANTIGKIIGDQYVLVIKEEDELCRQCQNLLQQILRLKAEKKTTDLVLRGLLRLKYSLVFSDEQSQGVSKKPNKTIATSHITGNCFVCDKKLESSDLKNDCSRNDLAQIISEIVGDGYFLVIKEEDHLCKNCHSLTLKNHSQGSELRSKTLAMRALLRIKYSLDFHGVTDTESRLNYFRPRGSLGRKPLKKNKKKRKSHAEFENSFEVTNENYELMDGSYKVMDGSYQVLDGNYEVVDGTYEVVDGSYEIMEGTYEVVDESFEALQSNTAVQVDKVIEEDVTESLASFAEVEMNNSTELQNESGQDCLTGLPVKKKKNEKQFIKSNGFCLKSKMKKKYKYNYTKKKVIKPYKCGRCAFKSATFEELESHHLQMNSNEDLYCEICDFSFHQSNLLKQHLNRHSSESLLLQCRLCKQAIYDRLHMKYHIRTVHRSEQEYVCNYCKKVFLWKGSLNVHVYRHHISKPNHVCENCKAVYVDYVKYCKHIEYAHRGSLKCKYCFKLQKNIDSLVNHERTHRLQGPIYNCQHCFRKYRNPANLRLHEKQHSGTFEFMCEKCSLGFEDLYSFEKHQAKHPCIRTPYSYIQQPTMCEICGKVYSNKISFRNHHLLHYNSQPFECNICFKKFRYQAKVAPHKKRFHPEIFARVDTNTSEQTIGSML